MIFQSNRVGRFYVLSLTLSEALYLTKWKLSQASGLTAKLLASPYG